MKLKYQKSTGLKVFSIDDIRAWKPCYDPAKHLPEGWRGTLVDLAAIKSIPPEDVLWCAFRTDLLSEKLIRLHAVWSYRQTISFLPNQDPRCIEAANVAERYAEGRATKEELAASASAAYSASASALAAPYVYAAFSAAYSSSPYVSVSVSAIFSSASAAASTASAAASTASSAMSKQVEKLLEMALIEGKERLEKQAKIKARKKK